MDEQKQFFQNDSGVVGVGWGGVVGLGWGGGVGVGWWGWWYVAYPPFNITYSYPTGASYSHTQSIFVSLT